jgi:spore coat-associated protein N
LSYFDLQEISDVVSIGRLIPLPPKERPETMQRVTALWQASPNKIVGALFALALAAMMAVASGASFTSTSANVGNIVTAGNLSHENSKDDDMILEVDKLIPGGPAGTGTVTITNDGDVKGLFTLDKDNVVNSDTANPLSAKLDLLVEDVSDTTPVEIYEGKLGAMGEQDMGEIEAGESRDYRFSVSFPEGGPPPSATTGDNAYKGDKVEVDYHWESVTE